MHSTKNDPVEILKQRGFLNQCTDEAGLIKALDEGPVTFYVGFDPTASSLHVGHLVQLMCMGHLARAGHNAIGVVGGGTGMIGDPAGRNSTRDMLTPEAIEANLQAIHGQIQRFCPQAAIVNNADWLLQLRYIDFLRDIGCHFSVNRMLSSEGTQQRLERNQGLSFIEFNYVLLQSYDFLELYRRNRCRLQIGGGDQWFNIIMGVDLIRRMEGAEAFGWTTPLLTTATGAKMGKTAAGAVWLDANLTSAFDYYQYWYNVDDRDVTRFFRIFTWLDLAEIDEVVKGEFRDVKHRLALEATSVVHGPEVAAQCQAAARAMFSGGATENMPTFQTALPRPVVDLLASAGLCKSKADARRMIEQGGISIGETRVTDIKAVMDAPGVLWAGKKRAVRVLGE